MVIFGKRSEAYKMSFFLFTDISEQYMLPCLNKRIFGIDCPGCGIQRSVALLFQGDFVGAFHMYPAIYPLFMLLFILVLSVLFKNKILIKLKIFFMIASVVTVLINYILKITNIIH